MTAGQAERARDLLRQAVDWIGIVELTDEEEGRAEAIQTAIADLLREIGGNRPADAPEDVYRVVVAARERLRISREEQESSRERLGRLFDNSATYADHALLYAVRRYNVAYNETEQAEAELMRAEADYCRSLVAGQGADRCSAA